MTDVRAVPLAQLTLDADARHLAITELENKKGPAQVLVAMFNSAI